MINAQKSRGAKNMRLLCLTLLICAKAFVPPSIRTFPPTSREVLGQQRRNVECLEKEKSQHRRLQQEGKFWRATQEDAQSDDNPVILGVIVCDHGSRRKQANDMLLEVAERYRTYAGFDVVEAAHMEMAEPTIEQAFDRCVAAGAKRIVLHPFFLSPGRHVTSDIPELMQAAGRRHPDVPWLISEPLGLQELMPRVMHAAVQESVASGMWHRGDGGVDD